MLKVNEIPKQMATEIIATYMDGRMDEQMVGVGCVIKNSEYMYMYLRCYIYTIW